MDARSLQAQVPLKPKGDIAPSAHPIRVGTAGWSNPPAQRDLRPSERSHLQHYAACFNCVEINSSFYRPHQRKIYQRWAASTDRSFRFSVKIPKSISHERGLRSCQEELEAFLGGIRGLGAKLAVLLLQLPPQAEWHARVAGQFFCLLRDRIDVPVACEPRHPSWSGAGAERLFKQFRISLVCADPTRLTRSWSISDGIRYYRLHGSPRLYWSRYGENYLQSLAHQIAAERVSLSEVWCIFDNTAAGAAWENAETLNAGLRSIVRRRRS